MSQLPKGLLSIGKAAAALGVSIDTLRNWEKQGKLLPVKTEAGTRKYRKADINQLIREQGVKVRKIYERPVAQAPAPFVHPRHELEALKPLLQETAEVQEPSIRSLTQTLDTMVDGEIKHDNNVIFNPSYQPTARFQKPIKIFKTTSRWTGTTALGLVTLLVAATTVLTMGYMVAPGHTSRAVAKLPIPSPVQVMAETLVMGFDAQHAAKLGFGKVSSPRDPLIVTNIAKAEEQVLDPNGNVLGRTIATGAAVVQLNANTTVYGNVFADNIVNAITAGENLTLTGSLSNPILSASLPASILNTVNNSTGALTIAAGSDISVTTTTASGTTTITIADTSTLSTVRSRGGCSACIVDGDVAEDLTISSAGSVSGTAINSAFVAAAYGGTGLTSYNTGDLIYANSSSTLTNLPIGSTGQVLTVQGGVPVWTSAVCAACLVQNPTSNSANGYQANVISPTTANITGLTVLANSDSTGSPDIFRVQNAGGSTTLFKVGNDGNVTSNNTLYFGNGTTYSINSSAVATLLSIQNTPIGTVTPVAGNFSSIGATTPGTALFTTLDSTGNTLLASGAGSGLTVGTATGTFALTSNALSVTTGGSLSGANSISNSGVYTQSGTSANTFTGTTTFSSSSTYAALFTGGNVGVGDTTPAYLFTVGNGDLFGVNSSGAIVAAAGLTSSGTITFSDVTDGGNAGIIHSSSTGVLSSSVINLAGGANEVTGGLHPSFGGTGQTVAPTDGQLLIGNSSTSNFTLSTLTAGSNFSVTNGNGSITVTPSLTPTYTTVNGLALTSNADGYTVSGGTTSRSMTVTGSNITLTGGGNTLTLTGNTTLNQSLTTSSSPVFTGLTLPNTTNQLTLGGAGATNTTTLNSTAPSTSRTYTIPDFGSNDTFVGLAATQTLTNKTLSGDTIDSATISSPTITASTITGSAIGGGTPSTGAFTTLSSTGVTALGNNSSTVAVDTTSWDVSSGGAITGITGLTFASGNFDQSASSGTLSTGTGNVSLNGSTTIASGKTLTLASGNGTFNQTFLSGTNGAAGQTLTYTNANTGASSTTVNGINVALTNSTNTNSTNTLSGFTFEAGSNNNSNVINGINFESATGITNFLQTPSIDISSAGVITGASISGGSNTFSNIANSSLTNSSITFQTSTGLSGGATVSLGGTLTLNNTGVTSVAGTTNQVNTTGSTGSVTLSLPQSIATTSAPQFAGETLTGTLTMSGVTTDFTSASGENIALVPNGSGKVGIGATAPGSLFSVGTSTAAGGFQVDSNGNIVKLNGVTYSFPSAQAAGSAYVLQTNGSGTLSWVAQSSGTGCTPWSCLTDPMVLPTNATGNLALSMAAFTTTFTWGSSTGSSNLFNLTDTTNNTGTGYLNNITTATSSTLNPFHVGTGNGSLATDSITVTSTGNVGIGNTAPGTAFSVGASDRFGVATTGLITLNPASTTPIANITNSQTPISAGAIGTWATLNTLPGLRQAASSVIYNNYIYVAGGTDGTALSTVYSAQMKADGTIGTWATLNTMPQILHSLRTVSANGYLFVVGGNNGSAISTVYSAKFNNDGTIGTWNTLNTLPTLLYSHTADVYNGYLFVTGGNTGSVVSTVYSAPINGNGTIGTWATLNTLPQLLFDHASVTYNGFLYIFGGSNNGTAQSTVYSAAIKPDGTIGTWNTLSTMPQILLQQKATVANGYVYVAGGNDGTLDKSTVYSAQLKGDGTLGTWATLNTLPSLTRSPIAVATSGYLFVAGGAGASRLSTVYSTPLGGTALATNTSSSWANGNLLDLWNNGSSKLAIDYAGNLVTAGSVTASQFQSTASTVTSGSTGTYATLANLPTIHYRHGGATYNGYIYVVGGNNGSGNSSTVYSARANADGTIGSWNTLNTLPTVLIYPSAVAVNGYLFVVGGNNGATISTVYSAQILPNGTIGSWNTLNTLPLAIDRLASVAFNDYLYIFGGANASNASTSAVYSAKINGNGTIGTWATLNTMPALLRGHAAVVSNGYVFITGGNTGSVVSTVYSASLKTDGTIGTWQTLTALPAIHYLHQSFTANGYLYTAGGSNSVVSTVYSAKINADGTIGSWTTLNTLPSVTQEFAVVTANGYMFMMGGFNASTGMSTVYSTPLQSNALAYTTSLPQTNGNILDFWNNNTQVGAVDYTGRFLANAGLQINQQSTTPGANFTSSQTGVNAGGIGSWQTLTNLPITNYSHDVASYNGYVYVVGGYSGGVVSTVYSAKVNADGTIGAWQALNTLPTSGTDWHKAIASNGYLFMLGGSSNGGGTTISTVYSTKINDNGTIGSWTTLNTLPQLLQLFSGAAYNGYIYITGGCNSDCLTANIKSTVYSAQINGNGTIGTWQTLNTLPTINREHTTVATNGYLFVIGGYNGSSNLSTVYSAAIKPDGTIGTWATLNTLPATRIGPVAVAYNGYIYVTGGVGQSTVYSAKINGDGTVGVWSILNTLPTIISYHGAAVVNGYLLIPGGYNNGTPTSTVYSTPLQSTSFAFNTTNQFTNGNLLDVWNGTSSKLAVDYAGNISTQGSLTGTSLASTNVGIGAGSTGTWQTLNPLPAVAEKNVTAYYNGYIFVAGGCTSSACSSNFSTVYSAKVNADGTVGGWQTLNTLPGALASISGVAANGYLYALGGNNASTGTSSAVYFAAIKADGTIGSWNTTSTLPSVLQNHAVVTSNGYIFAIGGYNGAVASTVFSAKILGNGTLETWQTLNTLPGLRSWPGAAAYNGYIFVIGGDSGANSSTVYSAPVKADGTIGSWSTLNTIPTILSEMAVSVANGYIYVAGGTNGSATVSTLFSAQITADGKVGSWSTLATMPAVLQRQGLVTNGSYLFLVGGDRGGSTTVSTVYSVPVQSSALAFQSINTFNAGNLLDVWNNGAQVANIDYSGRLNTNVGIQLNQLANSAPSANFTQSLNGLTAGSTGTWQTLPTLPAVSFQGAATSYNGYIFFSGGDNGSAPMSTIYSTKVNADGTAGAWNTLSTLPQILYGHSMVAANGYIFVTGGYNNSAYVSTVYSAAIRSDGTIGPWNTLATMPRLSYEHTSFAANGYLFLMGGSSNGSAALSTTYSAQILSNGTLGTWATLNTLPKLLYALSSSVSNGYVFVTGGYDGSNRSSTVYSARLNTDGTIGTWNTLTALPLVIRYQESIAYNGYLYVMGGENGAGAAVSTVYIAQINSDGTIGSWSTLATMPAVVEGQTMVQTNGYAISIGGFNGSSRVSTAYSVALQSDAFAMSTTNQFTAGNLLDIWNNGSQKFSVDYAGNIVAGGVTTAGLTSGVTGIQAGGLGTWNTLTNLPVVEFGANSISYNGYIFVVGGDTGSVVSTVYSAKTNADGTIGAWNTLNTLPAVTVYPGVTTHNGYLFITGGKNGAGTSLSTVYSTKINADGTIGNWNTLNTLPAITSANQAVAHNGYLFVMGGTTNGSVMLSTIYSAQINGNGTIGTWATLNTIPQTVAYHMSVVSNGYIFVIGGNNGGGSAISTVYSAPIKSDGTIGTWATLNTLPALTQEGTAVTYNGYLYVLGGFTGSANSTVYGAKVNTDGTIGTWATLNTLPGTRYDLTATVSNGYIFVLGGYNGSTRFSTVYSAPLQSDSMAFNTTNTQTAGNLIDVVNNGQSVASIDYQGRLNSVLGVQINNTSTTPTANLTQSLSGLSAGSLGSWQTLSTLPNALAISRATSYNGYIYFAGGQNAGGSVTSAVYMTKVNADGTIGNWTSLNTLPQTLYGNMNLAYNGYLYSFGGYNGSVQISLVYSAKINSDGTISAWNTLSTMPALVRNAPTVAYNGYIFIAGGYTGSYVSTVYSAQVKSDGTIGTWQTLNTLPALMADHGGVAYNGYLFVLGGDQSAAAISTVYSAPIRSDGTIGTWNTLNTLPTLLIGSSAVVGNGYIYVAGGCSAHSCGYASTVYAAQVNSDGTIGKWATVNGLPTTSVYGSAVTTNGYLIFMAGTTTAGANLSTVYSAPLQSDAFAFNTLNTMSQGNLVDVWNNGQSKFSIDYNGSIGTAGSLTLASSQTPSAVATANLISQAQAIGAGGTGTYQTLNALPAVNMNTSTVASNGYVFVVGGNTTGSVKLSTVYSAKVKADGTLNTWSALTTLPVALAQHVALAANGYIFVIGGNNAAGNSVSTVYSAQVRADGTIGAWSTTSTIPVIRRFAAGASYNGYLYLVGGNDDSAAVSTVYYAQINGNGTVSTWATLNTLPAVNQQLSVTAANGYLFVAGGLNGSTTVYSTVYSAPIKADGTIGTWATMSTLPALRYLVSMTNYNGYLYVVGGASSTGATSTTSTVYTAQIKSDGTLGTWTIQGNLPTVIGYANLAVSNGYLFVIGGSNSGAIADALSTVYSTPLQSEALAFNIGGTLNNGNLIDAWNGNTAVFSVDYKGTVNTNSGIQINQASNTPTANMISSLNGITNGSIGTWTTTTPLPISPILHSIVSYNGYMYLLGGHNGSSFLSTVYYSKVNTDGSLGGWNTTSTLPAILRGAGTAVSNGYLFVVGGENGSTQLSTVYSAKINADGSVATWNSLNTLPVISNNAAVVAVNGYLYNIAGFNGSLRFSTVYYAQINGNGTIGTWNTTTTIPQVLQLSRAATYNGYIFLTGGNNVSNAEVSTVYSAAVKPDGTLGTWATLNTLPNPLGYHAAIANNGYLYVMGGLNGATYQSGVYAAQIKADGTIGTWASLNTLPTPTYYAGVTISNGYLYFAGGQTQSNGQTSRVYMTPLQSTAFAWNTTNIQTNGNLMDIWNGSGTSVASVDYTGRFLTNTGVQINNGSTPQANLVSTVNGISAGATGGSWQTLTPLPAINSAHATVGYNGYIYNIGGLSPSNSSVYYAQVKADGTISGWNTLNTLPAVRRNLNALAYNSYLYVIGGSTTGSASGSVSTLYSARINADGTIGSWTTLNTLPAVMWSMGASAYNNYLFITGGENGGGGLSTVYSAPILGNGTIGTWATLATLPGTMTYHQTVVYNGYLFTIGGGQNVYSTPIKPDGTIGSWTAQNTLPVSLSLHGVVQYNNYVIISGGSGGVLSTVYSARLNADGTTTAWTSLTTMPTAAIQHGATIVNGYMIVTGGNNGANLSGVYSTPVYSDALAINTTSTYTAGNLLDFWNAGTSKFSVDYNGNLTSGGVTTAQINSNVQGITAGSTGTYQTLTNLPAVRMQLNSTSANGYVYVLGGHNGSARVSTVYSAKVNADGTLGSWATLNTLAATLNYLGVTNANGYLFVVGGHNGSSATSLVYSAKLNADGTIGSWNTLTNLPVTAYGPGVAAYNGYIFVTAGFNSDATSTVYSAQINGNGTIGSWQTLTTLPALTAFHRSEVVNGYLFVMGGYNGGVLSTVYSAPIKADGTIGSWATLNTLPAIRSYLGSATSNGYLFVVGGSSDGSGNVTVSTVYSAQVNADGTIGKWAIMNTLPAVRGFTTATISNGYLFQIGGTADGTVAASTVYSTPLGSNALAYNAGTQTNGNLLDIQNNGSSKFGIDYNGNVTATGFTFNPASTTPAAVASAQFASSIQAIPAGGMGAITTNTPYPLGVEGINAVSYDGYIYAMGGDTDGGGTQTSAGYYAKVRTDGTFGPWIRFNMAEGAFNISAATYQGYLFVAGGYTTLTTLSTVYSAKIASDGSLGSWATLNTLPIELASGSGIAADGYFYVADGNGTSNVYSAPILADGKIGTWQTLSVMPVLLSNFTLAHYNGFLYSIGGFCGSGASCPNGSSNYTSVIYSAKITKPGTLGTWSSIGVLPVRAGDNGSFVANGYLYAVAGSTVGSKLSTVYSAKINSDGTFGNWATIATFPDTVSSAGVTSVNGYMITVAGNGTANRLSTTYSAPIQSTAFAFNTTNTMSNGTLLDVWNGGISKASVDYAGNLSIAGQFQSNITPAQDGILGTWQTLNTLPSTLYGNRAAVSNGYLYVVGGFDGALTVSTVYSAQIKADGTLGPWGAQATLAQLLFNPGVTESNGYLYVTGGSTDGGTTRVSTVYSVKTKADGTVGTWATLNTLPALNFGMGTIATNGYLFVIGGGDATRVSTVYSAKLNGDGTIGTWQTLTNLPDITNNLLAAAYNGYIFVLGGSNGAILSTVYSAPVKADGTIGTWATLNTMPAAIASAFGGVYNGYLYIFGGNGPSSSVYAAAVKADGTIGTWATLNTLPRTDSNGYGAFYNGYIFMTAGNNGAGTSTVYSASLTTSRAFVFNTTSTYPEGSSLGGSASLFTLQNNGDARFTLDAQGNGRFLGNLYASGAVLGTPGQVGDLAENVPVADMSIEAGDVVATGGASGLVKSSRAYDSGLVGVISTKPSLQFSPETPNSRAVALAGRVPVKVSLEGGAINAGDYLTSSSQPGVAMRATRPGVVIGQALEEPRDGKVLTFVQVGFVDPSEMLTQLSVDTAGNLMVPRLKTGQLLLGATEATVSAEPSALEDVLTLLKTNTQQEASTAAHIADARSAVYSLQNAQVLGLETTVASQSAAIADLQTKLQQLTVPVEPSAIATPSATIADLNITETFSTLQLAAGDATFSNSFTVLGDAVLGNTTIAGSLQVASASGGLAFSGTGITGLTSINAGKVDFFNGLVTIDTNGSLSAQTISSGEVVTNEVIIDSSAGTVGTGKIVAGTTSVVIEAHALTDHSKVFVTPNGLAVINPKVGESFEVVMPAAAGTDVEFKWWIIEAQ